MLTREVVEKLVRDNALLVAAKDQLYRAQLAYNESRDRCLALVRTGEPATYICDDFVITVDGPKIDIERAGAVL